MNSIFIPDLNFTPTEMAVGNKLFATFVDQNILSETITNLTNKFTILYGKIFVLSSIDTEELILTYNIDVINTRIPNTLPNTILVHRKKDWNVLYSLNALNEVIKSLNNGVLDITYRVDWSNYRNSILLTQDGVLKKIHTKIYEIIEL